MIRLSSRHLLFGVVSLALLTSSMQFSMVSVAIPNLIKDLDAPLAWVGWVVTMYTLMQAVSMPISGKLSDELGRRIVFVGGLAMFAAASLVCALARTFGTDIRAGHPGLSRRKPLALCAWHRRRGFS